jgi:hypothetical protein
VKPSRDVARAMAARLRMLALEERPIAAGYVDAYAPHLVGIERARAIRRAARTMMGGDNEIALMWILEARGR